MTDASDRTRYRLLHAMIRVKDLEKSLDFYTRHLGMRLLRRREFPDGRFTLAFVGYGEEADNTVIELTHNWDQEAALMSFVKPEVELEHQTPRDVRSSKDIRISVGARPGTLVNKL